MKTQTPFELGRHDSPSNAPPHRQKPTHLPRHTSCSKQWACMRVRWCEGKHKKIKRSRSALLWWYRLPPPTQTTSMPKAHRNGLPWGQRHHTSDADDRPRVGLKEMREGLFLVPHRTSSRRRPVLDFMPNNRCVNTSSVLIVVLLGPCCTRPHRVGIVRR